MRLIRNTPLQDTRIDQKNTPEYWKKIRNVAGVIFMIGGFIVSAQLSGNITLPENIMAIVTIITSISGTLSGAASITKK